MNVSELVGELLKLPGNAEVYTLRDGEDSAVRVDNTRLEPIVTPDDGKPHIVVVLR